MRRQRLFYIAFALAWTLLSSFGTDRAQAGTITYQVTVDTATLYGQYGYLDFQLNPGGIGAALASTTITNFTTDGALNPNDPANNNPNNTYGDWSGSLTNNANPLTLNNDAYTEFFEGFTYGNSIGFDATLYGAAVGNSSVSPFGSSFAFSLYDNTGNNPLLTTDPSGSVLTIYVNADGTTSAVTFPQSSSDNTPAASIPPLPSSVPAPPSIVLFILAAPAGLVYRRRSRSPQTKGPLQQSSGLCR